MNTVSSVVFIQSLYIVPSVVIFWEKARNPAGMVQWWERLSDERFNGKLEI